MQVPNDLGAIAKIIREDWKNIYWTAKPYLHAMECLEHVSDVFADIPGREIVYKFLENAAQWQGPTATSIKAHLQRLVIEAGHQ